MSILNRQHIYRDGEQGRGPLLYWMSRDQRADDNDALVFAQNVALQTNRQLIVVFCLVPEFIGAAARQYDFMLYGLKNVSAKLKPLNIPFCILFGKPENEIPAFCNEADASMLVTDFDPLKIKKYWKSKISERIAIPFHEIDTHNIVPCRVASPKQEWAAYTIRPKINRLLVEYLTEPEKPLYHNQNDSVFVHKYSCFPENYNLNIGSQPGPVDWIQPGEYNAMLMLNDFLDSKLDKYAEHRNDPAKNAVSNLSPYLHFGMISAKRVAYEVQRRQANEASKVSFLEELIIRRELADNFCFYNENYDNTDGFADWAKASLNQHRGDIREFIYSVDRFEGSQTHDPLWNAAQNEMVRTGKMHGYMRMYWAKKILEWSESPEAAFETAIYLNDKYELDGRDPNGYTGIAWSIGGVHDRAWFDRPVFGKIRFMSYNGMKSKFDIGKYIEKNK